MSNHPADSSFNSIKGKIWISAIMFAVSNCILGIGSYLALSMLVSNPLIPVILSCLITGGAFVFFGRWLAAAVLEPIEKVSRLAKSLERSPTDSLPTETGATETDELLQSLLRTNRQLQNMVGIVESVAQGNTNAALTKLENPDRLSSSFQKMLTKVTDSINAKDELNDMQTVLDQIRNGIARVRNPEIEGEPAGDPTQGDEITDAFQVLISDLDDLLVSVRANAIQARAAAAGVKQSIQSIIELEETRVKELNHNAFEFGKAPNAVLQISRQLADSISAAAPFIESPADGSASSEENVNAVNDLRKLVKDAIKRIQRLSERTQKITGIAELAEDLARRSKLVALNVSLQGTEGNGNKTAASALAAEVDSLASRSETMNKEISSIEEAVTLEIGEVEAALRSTAGEIANISAFVIENENTVTECRRHFENIVRLQADFDAAASTHSDESDRSFRELAAAISETENTAKVLRQSEDDLFGVLRLMDDLHATVNRFRLLPLETEMPNTDAQPFQIEPAPFEAAAEFSHAVPEPLHLEPAPSDTESELLEVGVQVLEDFGSNDFEKRSDNYSGGQLLEI